MKAQYIVLEGIQGTGKTTQAQLLADYLRAQGIPVHTTREPGGADLTARAIRAITQDPTYPIDTKTEVLLYNASRARSLEIVRDMLARNVWVICDRNFLTTLAIQYYAQGEHIDYDDIVRICEFAVGDMMPDQTVILDLPTEKAVRRLRGRHQGERFDNLDTAFLERMRQGFLKEAATRHYPVIDANGSEKTVHERIRKATHIT